MATEQPKAATEDTKIDLFEDDDEFEEFEIDQGMPTPLFLRSSLISHVVFVFGLLKEIIDGGVGVHVVDFVADLLVWGSRGGSGVCLLVAADCGGLWWREGVVPVASLHREWENKEEGKEVTQQWEDDWDDDDVNDDFSLQLRRELESNIEKN
ncbi:hypothetical protein ACH5RR_025612 [Cinchona calisaya]|uniref:26S proteasome complex subunit SEM1 n=1 Tax=Cinchona calisaya TaxID=153742 RepID=A0ABD2Z3I0_9GENT